MKKIKDLMHTRVVTVEMDDLLSTVREIFSHTHFHHILVIDKGRLKGMVSDRDLFKAISPNIGTAAELQRDRNTLKKRVHQIMTRDPITLDPNAEIADAVSILMTHSISCIPIVDALMQVRGIISWRDLLPELIEQQEQCAPD